MTARLVLVVWALVLSLALGCAISNYPVITDDRGDYSGIVRTGHKAYVTRSFQVATFWPDGTDELYTLVYQNAYGDQKLYTFNNFDPTGAVTFLDQTYCDWTFEDCEIVRCWNPVQNDEPFDYEFFQDCSGARSLDLLLSLASRIRECGDALPFRHNLQEMAETFANLDATTWRGERAYHLPIDAHSMQVTLTSVDGARTPVPIIGRYDLLITDDMRMLAPMTPNARHQRRWLLDWVGTHGPRATMAFQYEGVSGEIELRFLEEGLAYNANRH